MQRLKTKIMYRVCLLMLLMFSSLFFLHLFPVFQSDVKGKIRDIGFIPYKRYFMMITYKNIRMYFRIWKVIIFLNDTFINTQMTTPP